MECQNRGWLDNIIDFPFITSKLSRQQAGASKPVSIPQVPLYRDRAFESLVDILMAADVRQVTLLGAGRSLGGVRLCRPQCIVATAPDQFWAERYCVGLDLLFLFRPYTTDRVLRAAV